MNAGAFIIIESIVIGVLFTLWKIFNLIEWNIKNKKTVNEKRTDKYDWSDLR